MGFHEDAARYLEIYRHSQGNTPPPAGHCLPHPGFLSIPEKYSYIRWINEHGAILWAVSEHYLLTRDEAFLNKWLPSILAACQWVYDQRRHTDHPGVTGILPPAIATDEKQPDQYIWNDGWVYKGLTTAIKVLKSINHPEAANWANEAAEYKVRFNEVFSEVCKQMPAWKADDGTERRLIPTKITGDTTEILRHAFYLDTGPLFLAFSGLVDI